MNHSLDLTISIAALLLAAVSGLWAALNRPVPRWQLLGAVLVEVLAVAVVVDAGVRLGSGHRPHELAIYIGYLIGLLLMMPLGVFFALVERTRFGSVILAVAALLTPVLIARLLQILRA